MAGWSGSVDFALQDQYTKKMVSVTHLISVDTRVSDVMGRGGACDRRSPRGTQVQRRHKGV